MSEEMTETPITISLPLKESVEQILLEHYIETQLPEEAAMRYLDALHVEATPKLIHMVKQHLKVSESNTFQTYSNHAEQLLCIRADALTPRIPKHHKATILSEATSAYLGSFLSFSQSKDKTTKDDEDASGGDLTARLAKSRRRRLRGRTSGRSTRRVSRSDPVPAPDSPRSLLPRQRQTAHGPIYPAGGISLSEIWDRFLHARHHAPRHQTRLESWVRLPDVAREQSIVEPFSQSRGRLAVLQKRVRRTRALFATRLGLEQHLALPSIWPACVPRPHYVPVRPPSPPSAVTPEAQRSIANDQRRLSQLQSQLEEEFKGSTDTLKTGSLVPKEPDIYPHTHKGGFRWCFPERRSSVGLAVESDALRYLESFVTVFDLNEVAGIPIDPDDINQIALKCVSPATISLSLALSSYIFYQVYRPALQALHEVGQSDQKKLNQLEEAEAMDTVRALSTPQLDNYGPSTSRTGLSGAIDQTEDMVKVAESAVLSILSAGRPVTAQALSCAASEPFRQFERAHCAYRQEIPQHTIRSIFTDIQRAFNQLLSLRRVSTLDGTDKRSSLKDLLLRELRVRTLSLAQEMKGKGSGRITHRDDPTLLTEGWRERRLREIRGSLLKSSVPSNSAQRMRHLTMHVPVCVLAATVCAVKLLEEVLPAFCSSQVGRDAESKSLEAIQHVLDPTGARTNLSMLITGRSKQHGYLRGRVAFGSGSQLAAPRLSHSGSSSPLLWAAIGGRASSAIGRQLLQNATPLLPDEAKEGCRPPRSPAPRHRLRRGGTGFNSRRCSTSGSMRARTSAGTSAGTSARASSRSQRSSLAMRSMTRGSPAATPSLPRLKPSTRHSEAVSHRSTPSQTNSPVNSARTDVSVDMPWRNTGGVPRLTPTPAGIVPPLFAKSVHTPISARESPTLASQFTHGDLREFSSLLRERASFSLTN